jgi:stearoyl-CoA desaturase (delta-9 desaturase)
MDPVSAIAAFFFATLMMGLGNTVGYHRLITHRSFKASRPLRWVLTVLGALHSGSPLVWVGLHRHHHANSDQPDDPHTPTRGFWAGHCGWLIDTRSPVPCMLFALSGFGQQMALLVHDLKRVTGRKPAIWREICPDLMREPFMRALDLPFVMPVLFAAQLGAVWWWGQWWGVVWLWAVHVSLTNASWAVNSICHWPAFGVQTYDTGEGSRDVGWVAWFTNGEGFHNSHHRFPKSARHGLHRGPDFSWRVIQLLVLTGLASDPWLPRKFRPTPSSSD